LQFYSLSDYRWLPLREPVVVEAVAVVEAPAERHPPVGAQPEAPPVARLLVLGQPRDHPVQVRRAQALQELAAFQAAQLTSAA
jgi:hypothetical protein